MRNKFFFFSNCIVIFGILIVLAMAYVPQFYLKELPCPLCLLQRLGFLAIVFSLLLNLKYGYRTSYYGLALLSTFFTGLIAMQQILYLVIHGADPGDKLFLGMHLYVWTFVFCGLILLWIAIMLLFEKQFKTPLLEATTSEKVVIMLAFVFAIILSIANAITYF